MMCMLQLNALFRSCEFLFVSAWVKSTNWVHDFRLFTSLNSISTLALMNSMRADHQPIICSFF
ncbi:hypothetical protein KC19_1G324000 [Ceratodon purpureus]|uniref:Uncharacterized protein n=1 Tax=Ceratodon purpureus TaxID=3225 RepID=A0A8T0JC30_CERPU|nr:hypothetical protein KC19_1G324000 [Ceratodon purpureus]